VPYEISPPITAAFPEGYDVPQIMDEDWRATYHAALEEARESVQTRARRVLRNWPRCTVSDKRLELFVARSWAGDHLAAWLICDACNERRIKERLWSRDRERAPRRERPIERNS
jgi:hypothetical protein